MTGPNDVLEVVHLNINGYPGCGNLIAGRHTTITDDPAAVDCDKPGCDYNPEHDPGPRPEHRRGSFLDKRDRRGLPTVVTEDPIARTTGAGPLGNTGAS